jgi:hypothetical protein
MSALSVALVIAQAAPTEPGGSVWLITQGALGVGCLAMGGVIRALWNENKALRDRERESLVSVHGTVLPTLAKTTEVVEDMTEAFKELTRELRQ